MSNEPQPEYETMAALMQRGWSGGLIDGLLGEPDHCSTNPYHRTGPPLRLYLSRASVGRGDTEDFRDR